MFPGNKKCIEDGNDFAYTHTSPNHILLLWHFHLGPHFEVRGIGIRIVSSSEAWIRGLLPESIGAGQYDESLQRIVHYGLLGVLDLASPLGHK